MKLFQRRQRSLFGEILDWMLTPFLLLWPITFGLTWLIAEGIASVPFDRSLGQNARALAQLVQSDESTVRFELPLPASEILHADETDDVYYQVLGAKGEYLGGDKELPLPQEDEKLVTDELRLRDDVHKGMPVRVAYIWVRVKPSSAQPIEVSPLVSSINDLLQRLQDSIATQKRFLADAAHQLKTPLAGLRMQADLALRKDANADDLKQSLHHIGRASIRATHTVNQLLALARAESSGAPVAKQACDLSSLTMEVVKDCLPRAMDKHIDLGFDDACDSAGLQGNPTLLKEMVRNLIENALNYTTSSVEHPGVVTARVSRNAKNELVLQVEDSGPGIPVAERERIFEPFYRILGTEADGSGLGLPIVLEIAHQHGATVTLHETHPGHNPPGAQFSVVFTKT